MYKEETMYTLNEEQRNNLLAFLNRVEYKGLKEVELIGNILVALSTKKEENSTKK